MLRLGTASGGSRTFHAAREDGVLLELSDVVVSYSRGALALRQHETLPAVGGVSLSVRVRQSVGLVGESGSGKTSLGRSIMRLAPLTSGRISVAEPGSAGADGSGRVARRLARSVQIIFQDPYSSLDPRHSVERIISDAMRVHRLAARAERSAGPPTCWSGSACRPPSPSGTPTSCPAASASGCASPGHWPCSRR